MPFSGQGRALYQPIWADDVASCILAVLDEPPGERHVRYELAGPQTLSHEAIVRLVTASLGRRRRLLKVPSPLVRQTLRLGEAVLDGSAPVTWDEAELLEVSLTTLRGHPRRAAARGRAARDGRRAGSRGRAQPLTGARRCAHGTAASSWAASASSAPSPSGWPISWTGTGRPRSSRWYSGTLIAGDPVRFDTGV